MRASLFSGISKVGICEASIFRDGLSCLHCNAALLVGYNECLSALRYRALPVLLRIGW